MKPPDLNNRQVHTCEIRKIGKRLRCFPFALNCGTPGIWEERNLLLLPVGCWFRSCWRSRGKPRPGQTTPRTSSAWIAPSDTEARRWGGHLPTTWTWFNKSAAPRILTRFTKSNQFHQHRVEQALNWAANHSLQSVSHQASTKFKLVRGIAINHDNIRAKITGDDGRLTQEWEKQNQEFYREK